MTKPLISVIITAFRQRPFLNMALDSVLNQSIDSSEYEILLVTNWKINLHDEKLPERVKTIEVGSSEDHINLIYIGIRESSGDILCFLDDDDIFESNKLQTIKEIFKNHGSVGFVHNAFKLIDINNLEIENPRRNIKYGQPRKDFTVKSHEIQDYFRKIVNSEGLINASSISLRKTAIENIKDDLLYLPGNYDGFLFYAYIKSGTDLYISSEILTFYRVHKLNNSKPESYEALLSYLSRLRESACIIDTYLSTNNNDLGKPELIYYSIKEKVAIGREKRSTNDIIKLFQMFVKYGLTSHLTMMFVYLLYFFTRKSYYRIVYGQ